MPPPVIAGFQGFSGLVQGAGQFSAGSLYAQAGDAALSESEKNAELLEKLGDLEAGFVRRDYGGVVSGQRAAFGRAGVRPGSGSGLDVMLDTIAEGELAALNAKYGRESQAYNVRVQGIQAQFAGEAAQHAARSKGISSIMSGVASGYDYASKARRFRSDTKVTVPTGTPKPVLGRSKKYAPQRLPGPRHSGGIPR